MIRSKEGRICLDKDINPRKAKVDRNNPDIWKWCRQYTLLSDQSQIDWVNHIARDPTIEMFAVRETNSALQIGVCGFTSIDHRNRKAEFSLYISPGAQGDGYGYEALETLVDHGFRDFGFNSIWGEVYDGNPAMKIFKKVGFSEVGIFRESYFRDGKFIDSVLIDILARNWF